MAYRATGLTSPCPTNSSRVKLKYRSPIMPVLTFRSSPHVFFMEISSFPNFSMLFSKLEGMAREEPDFFMIFIAVRLTAIDVESLPMLLETTPNTV